MNQLYFIKIKTQNKTTIKKQDSLIVLPQKFPKHIRFINGNRSVSNQKKNKCYEFELFTRRKEEEKTSYIPSFE